MGNDSWLNDLFGLGIFGLIIGLVVWIIATVITGYLLGIGIWGSMPSEIKILARAKLLLCYEEAEKNPDLELVEGTSPCEAAITAGLGKKHFWNEKHFPARCEYCGKARKLSEQSFAR